MAKDLWVEALVGCEAGLERWIGALRKGRICITRVAAPTTISIACDHVRVSGKGTADVTAVAAILSDAGFTFASPAAQTSSDVRLLFPED